MVHQTAGVSFWGIDDIRHKHLATVLPHAHTPTGRLTTQCCTATVGQQPRHTGSDWLVSLEKKKRRKKEEQVSRRSMEEAGLEVKEGEGSG